MRKGRTTEAEKLSVLGLYALQHCHTFAAYEKPKGLNDFCKARKVHSFIVNVNQEAAVLLSDSRFSYQTKSRPMVIHPGKQQSEQFAPERILFHFLIETVLLKASFKWCSNRPISSLSRYKKRPSARI